jgi:predicted RNA-binding Zn-ribbon protein involved in translation (DUF1610 family)
MICPKCKTEMKYKVVQSYDRLVKYYKCEKCMYMADAGKKHDS